MTETIRSAPAGPGGSDRPRRPLRSVPPSPPDRRLHRPDWDAGEHAGRGIIRLAVALNALFALWYLGWLVRPDRVGNPLLFGVLAAAEAFNLAQAGGFWWVALADRPCPPSPCPPERIPSVDVLIPVYNEPVDIVEPTVAAATRLRGADVRVLLCDDGDRPEMADLAARCGVALIRRPEHHGAKAGNLNHALAHTSADLVAVFDCDHVPDERFLEATVGHFDDDEVGFVQTPQHYANAADGPVQAASAAQQRLFFGVISRGKHGQGAAFCCGTNVVFRRSALQGAGGFPEDSLTEDFALSIELHESGWQSRYVAEVLASGLGPEDMASYVSQQRRWAEGCLAAVPTVLRARLPIRRRLQYLTSSLYFLSGWTVLVYMALPVLRILTGAQPLSNVTADQFLLHFAPYFLASLATVVVASGGAYTFAAFALSASSFGIHVRSTVRAVLGRRGRFVVTPKRGGSGRQLRPIAGPLLAIAVLLAAIVWGLGSGASAATLNNIAYALIHVTVLAHGLWPALAPERSRSGQRPDEPVAIDLRDEAA